jgi:hypothetical protein
MSNEALTRGGDLTQADRLIFLDIDGVLNRHDFNTEAQSSTFCPDCVRQLNRVIDHTGAKIVLSSAWRYMVHGGAITLKGFEYLLRTHGVTAKCEVVSVTEPDETVPGRGAQIRHWIEANAAGRPPLRFVVVDDEPALCDEIESRGLPLVRTDPRDGLTAKDADAVIAYFQAEAPTP